MTISQNLAISGVLIPQGIKLSNIDDPGLKNPSDPTSKLYWLTDCILGIGLLFICNNKLVLSWDLGPQFFESESFLRISWNSVESNPESEWIDMNL